MWAMQVHLGVTGDLSAGMFKSGRVGFAFDIRDVEQQVDDQVQPRISDGGFADCIAIKKPGRNVLRSRRNFLEWHVTRG